jgi:hypothetical protein
MELKPETVIAEYQSKVLELSHEVIMLKAYIKELENGKQSK